MNERSDDMAAEAFDLQRVRRYLPRLQRSNLAPTPLARLGLKPFS